jgi:hypothetical protein
VSCIPSRVGLTMIEVLAASLAYAQVDRRSAVERWDTAH